MRKDYQAWLRMARYWYGNNRKVDGFFWEAHQLVQSKSVSTPLRHHRDSDRTHNHVCPYKHARSRVSV